MGSDVYGTNLDENKNNIRVLRVVTLVFSKLCHVDTCNIVALGRTKEIPVYSIYTYGRKKNEKKTPFVTPE